MPDIEGNAEAFTRSLLDTVGTIRLLAGGNVRLRFDRANARHRNAEAFTRYVLITVETIRLLAGEKRQIAV